MADINYPQRWLEEHTAEKSIAGWHRPISYEVLKCQKDLEFDKIDVEELFLMLDDEYDCDQVVTLVMKYLPKLANNLDFTLTISDPTLCNYNEQKNALEFKGKVGTVTITVTMKSGLVKSKTIKINKKAKEVNIVEGHTFINGKAELITFEFNPIESNEEIQEVYISNSSDVIIERQENVMQFLIKCNKIGEYKLNVRTNVKTHVVKIYSVISDNDLVKNIELNDFEQSYRYNETIHIDPILTPKTALYKDYVVEVENPDIVKYIHGKNALVTNFKDGSSKVYIKMKQGNTSAEFTINVKDSIAIHPIERFEIDLQDKIDLSANIKLKVKVFPEANNTNYNVYVDGDLEFKNGILTAKKIGSGTITIKANDGSGVELIHNLNIVDLGDGAVTSIDASVIGMFSTDPTRKTIVNFTPISTNKSNLEYKFIYEVENKYSVLEKTIVDNVESNHIKGLIPSYTYIKATDAYTGISRTFNFIVRDHTQFIQYIAIKKIPEKVNLNDTVNLELITVPEFAMVDSIVMTYDNEAFEMTDKVSELKAIKLSANDEETFLIDLHLYYSMINSDNEKMTYSKSLSSHVKVVDYPIMKPFSFDVKFMQHVYNTSSIDHLYLIFIDENGKYISGSSLFDNTINLHGVGSTPKHELYHWECEAVRDENGAIVLDSKGYQEFKVTYQAQEPNILNRNYSLTLEHPSSGLKINKDYNIISSEKIITYIDFNILRKSGDSAFTTRYYDNVVAVNGTYNILIDSAPASFNNLLGYGAEIKVSDNVKLNGTEFKVLKAGEVTIELKYQNISVIKKYDAQDIIEIEKIEFDINGKDCFVGDTIDLSPIVTPNNATFKDQFEFLNIPDNLEYLGNNKFKIKDIDPELVENFVSVKFARSLHRVQLNIYNKLTHASISDFENETWNGGEHDYVHVGYKTIQVKINQEVVGHKQPIVHIQHSRGISSVKQENGIVTVDFNGYGGGLIRLYSDSGNNRVLLREYDILMYPNYENPTYLRLRDTNNLPNGSFKYIRDGDSFAEVVYYPATSQFRAPRSYTIESTNNYININQSTKVITYDTANMRVRNFGKTVVDFTVNAVLPNGTIIKQTFKDVELYPKVIPVSGNITENIPRHILDGTVFNFKITGNDEIFRAKNDLIFEHSNNIQIISDVDPVKFNDFIITARNVGNEKIIIKEATSNRVLKEIDIIVDKSELTYLTFESSKIIAGVNNNLKFKENDIADFKILDVYGEENTIIFNANEFVNNKIVYSIPYSERGKGCVIYIKTSLSKNYVKHIFTVV